MVFDEPALDDPAALRECELEIRSCCNHLTGDFESSSAGETFVNFFEFIAWWEGRQGQLRKQQLATDGGEADDLGQDSEIENDTRASDLFE